MQQASAVRRISDPDRLKWEHDINRSQFYVCILCILCMFQCLKFMLHNSFRTPILKHITFPYVIIPTVSI